MNRNLERDLDQRVRDVLESVEQQGVDWVREFKGPDMDYALRHGLKRAAINAAQTGYHENQARYALDAVISTGIDFVRDGPRNTHLKYGLKRGLYDQEAIDNAHTQYQENSARRILELVELDGLDWIRHPTLGLNGQDHLDYGLQHGFFKQAAVDAAQKRYHENNTRMALRSVEEEGLDWVRQNPAFGHSLQDYLDYGLQHGLINQAAIGAVQRKFEKSHH